MAAKKQAAGSSGGNGADKPTTKSDTYSYISEQTGLGKKEIGSVFDALSGLIRRDLKKNGPGVFTVPGLMKIKIQRKPATKARKGINPFTKEEVTFKAKPSRNVVKIQPLKNLKDMV